MNKQLLYQAIMQSNMSSTTKSFLGQVLKGGKINPYAVWQGPQEGEELTEFYRFIQDQLKGKPNTRQNANWAKDYSRANPNFDPTKEVEDWDWLEEVRRESIAQ